MKVYFKIALIVCCAATFSLLTSEAATFQVQVGQGGQKFTPKDLTINVGDTVQWNWAGNHHSSTSGTPGFPDGKWDSGILNSGATFSFTFSTAGSLPYYCTPHGSLGMVGSITVNSSALPTVSIVVNDGSASEVPSSDAGRMTISRTGDTTADLTVLYAVSGTATNGTDYQRLRGRAVIRAGQSSAKIQIRAIDDTTAEPDETVILTLSPNAAYTIGSPNTGTCTIHSNE
jgi:plastocyanin